MIIENIYLAILISAAATYFCRFLGVLCSSNLSQKSDLFDWIKCVSIGIIVAVISKIIFFPEGILANTSTISRVLSATILIICYYLFNKNIILSVTISTLFFGTLNYFDLF